MATVEKTIFTNATTAFVNDINRGSNGLASMTTVYSTSDLSGMSDDDIQALTDIQSKDITAKCDIIKLDDGSTKIRSVGHNDNLTQGIYIRCYATYATDINGKQFLYAVKLNEKPQYITAYDGINSNAQSYGFTVKYDRTDKISFTKLSNLAATYQDIADAKSSAQSLASSVADSAQSYAQYNYVAHLTDNDDLFNLSQHGHYVISGTNPKNNPWGNKNIWADVFRNDYQTVIYDNTGNAYIRSNYDNAWKQLLTNVDYGSLVSTASSFANSAADSAQNFAKSYAQYNYINSLGNNDDILNLPQNGHYVIIGANPKNNPWGNKNIWADVYKTSYNVVIRDNTGNEYIRSNYDNIWRQTLNTYDYEHLNNSINSTASQAASNATSLANSAASSAATYAQYVRAGYLGNNDDLFNIPYGHFVISGANPKNNPWGNKNIWADVFKNDYQTIIYDNTGNAYIRSSFDNAWKVLLTNIDKDNLQTQINAANTNAVKDNHDGTITFNGINLSLIKSFNPYGDLFDITGPGMWRSSWGNQSTIDHFPGQNGAATIIALGAGDRNIFGLKLIVIDTWGNEYQTRWAGNSFLSWRHID